jgi:hypothetical protein
MDGWTDDVGCHLILDVDEVLRGFDRLKISILN